MMSLYAGGFQPIRKLKFFSQLGVDTAETKISACVLTPPLSALHIRPPVHCSYLNTSLLRLGPSRLFHSSPVSSPHLLSGTWLLECCREPAIELWQDQTPQL